MNVLVDHSGYELQNSGDIAMLMACVAAIQDHLPRASVRVITTDPSYLTQLVPTTTPIPVAPAIPHRGFLKRSNLQAAWRFGYKILRPKIGTGSSTGADLAGMIRSADLVVSGGGGFVNDSFVSHAMGVLSVLSAAQRRGVPTAMFGQGLGPLSNRWLRSSARQVLPRLDALGLREGLASPSIARSLGVPASKFRVTGDDALRLAGAGLPVADGGSLGLNLRMSGYSRVDGRHAEVIRDAIGDLIQSNDRRLIALPVSSYSNSSDLRAIKQAVPAWVDIELNELPTPRDLANAVANCRTVVTGSYHVAVFALARGIPVVALSNSEYYDAKFAGLRALFSDTAVRSISLSDADVRSTLRAALQKAWGTSDDIRRRTAAQAAEQANCREEFIADFLHQLA